jgi:signal transduction histidine kinase
VIRSKLLFSRATIRRRLLLWTVVGFLPALVLAAWLIYEAQRNQLWLISNQLHQSSRRLAQVVDRQIGQSEALLRALATSPHLDSGNMEAFYHQAKSLVAAPGQWIVANDPSGQQVVNTFVPWGTPLRKSPAPNTYAPQLEQGETHVSNLIPSAVQPEPVVAVVVPVMRQGKMIYALNLVSLPKSLSAIFTEAELPADWIGAVIDREGTIIARSRRAEEFIGRKATQDVREAISKKKYVPFESVSLDGQQVVSAIAPTPRFGFHLIVGAPRFQLYSPAHRLLTRAALIIAGLLAVSFLVATLTARRIARSVERLANEAEDLRRGVLPSGAGSGLVEVDKVSAALKNSAEELQSRQTELKRLNETLEARVRERTNELASANRALSLRNQELEDFAHIISHDMQASVQRMAKFADLLELELAPALGENGRFYVARIKVSAMRMSQLMRDILAFSAITAEPRSKGRVDLHQVVANVLGDLEMKIQQSGATVEVGSLHPVHAESGQMYHLVLNLVSNAIKFHRPDVPPRVRIESTRLGDMVHLVVQDNGIGFDERQAEKIFAPFYRLHEGEKFSGTGIGLAIVRRIADRHGGAVSARSTPGSGSRFEVRLPAAQE